MTWRGRIPGGRSLLLAPIVLAAACGVSESRETIDIDKRGPQVGEQVADFTLPDQNGSLVSLDAVLGPNGAILMFYRSADW
jgi:hypothetical protein